MQYYPIYLDIKNRNCLVVGGGSVGTRKVLTLLNCGGRVTVISPKLTEKLRTLAEKGKIHWISRPYSSSDMRDAFLVIGATDDEDLNRQLHLDAEKSNKLCNIADQPESCNFILPSIVNRGDLVVTISTSGKSPAYAKKLRKTLENDFGEEHAVFLKMMGAIRKKILSEDHEPEFHKPIFEKLVDSGIIELIRENNHSRINEILSEIVGEKFDFNALVNVNDEASE